MSRKKCRPNCIYFPKIDEIIEFYFDDNNVKHRINSQLYRCTYTGHIINFKHRCPYKETIISLRSKMDAIIDDNNENGE